MPRAPCSQPFAAGFATVDPVDSDGLWLKDRNGVQLSWEEMSDGYRAALALLTDILRHLMNAYGTDDLTERLDGKLLAKVSDSCRRAM